MDAWELTLGQEVWIGERRAVFLGATSSGAAKLRFDDVRGIRLVPLDKIRARPEARLKKHRKATHE